MVIARSKEFIEWFEGEAPKTQAIIDSRLERIIAHNHYGDRKNLGGDLYELRFKNGNRIYYTIKKVGTETMFLILGGNKNGQQKDINKAAKTAKEVQGEKD